MCGPNVSLILLCPEQQCTAGPSGATVVDKGTIKPGYVAENGHAAKMTG